MLGLSQEKVAGFSRMSRMHYAGIEKGRTTTTILEIDRVAAVLGLSASMRLFPGGDGIRDAAHARRLAALLTAVRSPLTARVEAPLPRTNRGVELRAWDLLVSGEGRRTAMELEMRVTDAQAMLRRIDLKRRDDPTDGFILLLADTHTNRSVMAEFAPLLAELPRLRPKEVDAALRSGRHPPSGLLFV
jgi:transcriptional regulator with XRE-family HTH domain